MFNPNFDPEKVRRFLWESRGQGDPGAVVVLLHDYLDLLEMYNAELKSKPARVVPFKDGYWVFAEEISFFTKGPENGQTT